MALRRPGEQFWPRLASPQPDPVGCSPGVRGAARRPWGQHTEPPSHPGRPRHSHLVEWSRFQQLSYKPGHREVPGLGRGWGCADTQRGKGRECRSGAGASGLGRGGPQVTSFPREPLCMSPGPARAPPSGPRRVCPWPPPEQDGVPPRPGPRPAPGAHPCGPPSHTVHHWPRDWATPRSNLDRQQQVPSRVAGAVPSLPSPAFTPWPGLPVAKSHATQALAPKRMQKRVGRSPDTLLRWRPAGP